jgi:SAM-dependent methyltransferase
LPTARVGNRISRRLLVLKRALWPQTLVVFPRPGSRRRLSPISRIWGMDRGRPIDRYYIESFLAENAKDIHGRVLEVEDNRYTELYGADVTQSDVLHVAEWAPGVTIVADLTSADDIESNTFDCIVLTQTLQLIYDVSAAVSTLYRILKPGGVVLATFPGISQIAREGLEQWSDHWRFTKICAERLFAEAFSSENVAAKAYGNVLAATAFLYGLATDELRQWELDYRDTDYELSIAVRAVKRPHM